ncbi:fibroblast growth factor receptor substrate 2-like [Osmerus mordax]|uniref:fibroblast growth factor receptor substrate 2-like n=1 Tax=Osmerus mordax TaxID=8014 RepID=UPI00351038AA
MGSCLSCPEKESIPDNHQTKFKVVNVDDDGNELGAGVMELNEAELVLHTHRRDDVRWPYLCLRRYGYDSNLFSFESGRRCQTGQGIFAFKCARAEEIFNMLQEVMHSHSISVVEEAVLEPSHLATHTHTPAALGYSVPTVPNGVSRIPSVGEEPSHPSSRLPSVASTRLPSLGDESTHPLLGGDEAIHTYVNTTGLLEDHPSPLAVPSPLDSPGSAQSQLPPTPPPPPRARPDPPPPQPEPQVLLESQGARFVLGPTPVQRQLMARERRQHSEGEEEEEDGEEGLPGETGEANGHIDTDGGSTEAKSELSHTQSNGSSSGPAPPSSHPVTSPRCVRPPPLTPDLHNVNNSAQRRTALLDYENLPALPPVWEARKLSREEEESGRGGGMKTPSVNGYNHNHHGLLQLSCSHPLSAALLEPSHNYVNTENVTAPLSAHRPETARRPDTAHRRTDGPSVFNFDFRRPPLGPESAKTLNYIEVEMENTGGGGGANKAASDSSNPHTPRTPTSPLPPTTPTRRTELYAFIDIERTAAMSSLQKARPRDDGTSRKTRHNSTELPTKSTV